MLKDAPNNVKPVIAMRRGSSLRVFCIVIEREGEEHRTARLDPQSELARSPLKECSARFEAQPRASAGNVAYNGEPRFPIFGIATVRLEGAPLAQDQYAPVPSAD